MNRSRHIAAVVAGIAGVLNFAPLLHAGPSDFIHPGEPQVHPDESITQPSFDQLIPTTNPVIVVTPPAVPASSDNLVHPTDQPVVPKGTK